MVPRSSSKRDTPLHDDLISFHKDSSWPLQQFELALPICLKGGGAQYAPRQLAQTHFAPPTWAYGTSRAGAFWEGRTWV